MPEDVGLPGGVGLSEAIEALREELTTAMTSGATSIMRFKAGPVELTVEAALTKNFGGKTGIKWWLVEASAEASLQSVVTQTLKLTLQPATLDNEGRVVEPLISGVEGSPVGDQSHQDRTTGAEE